MADIAATSTSLDSIVQCFEEGMSPEAILGEFETLSLAQVFGAITFYGRRSSGRPRPDVSVNCELPKSA